MKNYHDEATNTLMDIRDAADQLIKDRFGHLVDRKVMTLGGPGRVVDVGWHWNDAVKCNDAMLRIVYDPAPAWGPKFVHIPIAAKGEGATAKHTIQRGGWDFVK